MKSMALKRIAAPLFLIVCGAIFVHQFFPALFTPEKKLVFSFVYTGCNRLDRHDTSHYPSSANAPQLKQTFSDISALQPAPGLFVFAGDLVVNLKGDGGKTLQKQLDAWMPLYQKSPLWQKRKELPLVPIMGNHESDVYSDVLKGEYPDSANAKTWLTWIEKNGFDQFAGNGPGKKYKKTDALRENNNQKLTYSFRRGPVHFVLINTDTFTTTASADNPSFPANGWVAYHWIKDDLAKAQAAPEVSHIVVIGHKPLKGPSFDPGTTNIINTSQTPLADKLISLFIQTPKFTGYFAAHSHAWDIQWFSAKNRKIAQVIAGNAGSPLIKNWNPEGGVYFGFTQVNLYDDNTAGVISYRRPVPEPYDSPEDVVAATPAKEILIGP